MNQGKNILPDDPQSPAALAGSEGSEARELANEAARLYRSGNKFMARRFARAVRMRKKEDIEGEILALGWDTESVGSAKRATRGSSVSPTFATEWHKEWSGVLADIKQSNHNISGGK